MFRLVARGAAGNERGGRSAHSPPPSSPPPKMPPAPTAPALLFPPHSPPLSSAPCVVESIMSPLSLIHKAILPAPASALHRPLPLTTHTSRRNYGRAVVEEIVNSAPRDGILGFTCFVVARVPPHPPFLPLPFSPHGTHGRTTRRERKKKTRHTHRGGMERMSLRRRACVCSSPNHKRRLVLGDCTSQWRTTPTARVSIVADGSK